MPTDSTASSRPPLRPNSTCWYQEAVIYQLHVRSFSDSNSDGIGDFRGLETKLDYIQALGVTAIWLLPFFPSPLKDDGYDIADYVSINPAYGTLEDFQSFLNAAHQRDLRVITELVLNHTSDQHRWFQLSRRAAPGSKWRNFYVWSDSTDRYADARIIFQDFESSNWTWDSVAGAYFWHRFYHHQPDLNFDNPDVHQAMLEVIDFWFQMGVDGVRLDAVPYLYEREGTNCENLPETHAFLKKLRHHVDRSFQDKLLLAEANQWPEDAAAYLGNGDQCHMNFHFPLMPRLFVAVEREDRFPVVDILEQTPAIPAGCQWGIFLRNHDELTLEMVTDEERDYMYRVYARDPLARINLGIRRRLAPLLKNDRRKIELMNGLLLSLPGTPILYYGDELGMGDNIYLGDRNGVRTPMQWNADRNAGFSRTNPQRLSLPVIIDAPYHFEMVNVEVEEQNPHSLLWWMRHLVHLRNQYQAFGRGSFKVLVAENTKVLAFLRQLEGQALLVVANLSRFAQTAELDLSEYRGQTPVELFGQTVFPAVGELPYFLTLGPHAFYWFELKWPPDEAIELLPGQLAVCEIEGNSNEIFGGNYKGKLESAMQSFLGRDRWFGRSKSIRVVKLHDAIPLSQDRGQAMFWLLLLNVEYRVGESEMYFVPVILADDRRAGMILGDHPGAGIVEVRCADTDTRSVLCDASWENSFWQTLLSAICQGKSFQGRHGQITVVLPSASATPCNEACQNAMAPNPAASDPAVIKFFPYGHRSGVVLPADQGALKLYRHARGITPDFEISCLFSDEPAFTVVPKVYGALEYRGQEVEVTTVAIFGEHRASKQDAWSYASEELVRYLERRQRLQADANLNVSDPREMALVQLAKQESPAAAYTLFGEFLQKMTLLGRRVGQLHLALAANAPASSLLEALPFNKLYQRSLYQSVRAQVRLSMDWLAKNQNHLSDFRQNAVKRLLDLQPALLEKVRESLSRPLGGKRIRCHGNLNLRHVLLVGNDFCIVDFEGRPGASCFEQRMKSSPLRDVAAIVRSLYQVGQAARERSLPGTIGSSPNGDEASETIQFWFLWSAAAFLGAYLESTGEASLLPPAEQDISALLAVYMLTQACADLGESLEQNAQFSAAVVDEMAAITASYLEPASWLSVESKA